MAVPIWLRTIGFTVLMPGLIIVYAPALWIITPAGLRAGWPPDGSHLPGLAVFAIGFGIYLMCATRFGREGKGTPAPYDPPVKLVTGGLYRWTRNPMYVGVVTALLGEAWVFGSQAQLVYAAGIAVAFHLRVLLYEEPVLRRMFGAEFDAYCARVRRWGVV